jgi:hypothetical protein
MRSSFWLASLGALALVCGGCMSGPLLDNPARVPQVSAYPGTNPVYIPLGPLGYGLVFEKTLDVIDDIFEIAYSSRYDGRIETFPRTAPGIVQFWKPGSPDVQQRLLASFQSIRHYARVRITPADGDGFFVDVKVYKELEDLPRPTRSTAGAASFRSDNTVERQFEVVDATVSESGWIPLGRDIKLEQAILARLAHFDVTGLQPDCPQGTVAAPAPASPPPAPPLTPSAPPVRGEGRP